MLHIGFFESFLESDTILLAGDGESLTMLGAALRLLEDREATPLELHALPFVQAYRNLRLTAYPVGKESGVRRTDAGLPHFDWCLSEEGWLEAADKINGVIGSGRGHNWLDSLGVDDACIMISLNEYPAEWWRRGPSAF